MNELRVYSTYLWRLLRRPSSDERSYIAR